MIIEKINYNIMSSIYGYVSSGKRKERYDVILEPLQAVIQLALLSACPIGSKICIENNLLSVQLPVWSQGLTRSWNKDKREDVLLLFNAIQRFNKMYVIPVRPVKVKKMNMEEFFSSDQPISPIEVNDEKTNNATRELDMNVKIDLDSVKNYNSDDDVRSCISGHDNETDLIDVNDEIYKLMTLIAEMSVQGIDNLINTYSHADNPSITQALTMYKNVITHPERFSLVDTMEEGQAKNGSNMETVFSNIRIVWLEKEMKLVYNLLLLVKEDPSNYETYINGLNYILEPLHRRIRKWISDNIVY